jgi:hypothetical protein
MKTRLLLLSLLLCSAAGCADPLGPSAQAFTCQTQPRQYCSADLTSCWSEVDTYTSAERCPLTPIK